MTSPSCGTALTPTYFSSLTAGAATRSVAKWSGVGREEPVVGVGVVDAVRGGAVGVLHQQEKLSKTTTSDAEMVPSATVRRMASTAEAGPVGSTDASRLASR